MTLLREIGLVSEVVLLVVFALVVCTSLLVRGRQAAPRSATVRPHPRAAHHGRGRDRARAA